MRLLPDKQSASCAASRIPPTPRCLVGAQKKRAGRARRGIPCACDLGKCGRFGDGCWANFVTERRAWDKTHSAAARCADAAAHAERDAPVRTQPLGSCRMRSPIMFFCTAEVPPAIVMLSL